MAAAAPRRIYVRFVIDEPECRERGCTSVEGAYPTLFAGVARCAAGRGGSQVEKTVADLSINDQRGFRILFHGCTLLGIIIA